MCVGVALALSELPPELVLRHGLRRRVHDRQGEHEVRFLYRDFNPVLPVRHGGRLRIVRWGNRRGESRRLPCTGWTWKETVESGYWAQAGAEMVEVPTARGLEGGVWFPVLNGIRGLLVRDELGRDVAFMVCEPASDYYRRMTGARWMPALIGERI
jgi:hypothetical protein